MNSGSPSDFTHARIQWFPGHMAKAKRLILEGIDKADVVIEVVDARCPQASRNALLDTWVKKKPRVLVMNKTDVADPKATAQWKTVLENQLGITVVGFSTKEKKIQPLIQAAVATCAKRRWYGLRAVRALIVGIPNVGKSSILNLLAGTKKASVADRAGHTRGIQRYKVTEGFDVLDTPGVLWHKFEDPRVGRLLALLGAVKDEILPMTELAAEALEVLSRDYPQRIKDRFALEDFSGNGFELLEKIGRKRGLLVKGGVVDQERAGLMVVKEVREGLLGRITWELPGEMRLGGDDGSPKEISGETHPGSPEDEEASQ